MNAMDSRYLDQHVNELADLITENRLITPEQARKRLKLKEDDFWKVVERLSAYVEAGRPLPPRKTKWRDILAYG